MGIVAQPPRERWLLVAFSAQPPALDWARQQAESQWGAVALASGRFEFQETDYYRPSMGRELRLQMWLGRDDFDLAQLPERKLQTNAWESAYAQQADSAVERPLNLDPGYLTPAKLVLASTKDHLHRLYLGQGIYGEVTLHFSGGGWVAFPWTYPNYRRSDYQQFLTDCRQHVLAERRRGAAT